MAEVCLKIDRADEAFVHWKKAAELDPEKIPGERSNSANVDAAMKDEASRRLDWLFERAASIEYVPAIRFARQYVILDDTEKAFEWLDKACGEQNVFPLMIKSDPFYDRLRDDPRFEPILKKAELPVA
jgi:hypothetical protein